MESDMQFLYPQIPWSLAPQTGFVSTFSTETSASERNNNSAGFDLEKKKWRQNKWKFNKRRRRKRRDRIYISFFVSKILWDCAYFDFVFYWIKLVCSHIRNISSKVESSAPRIAKKGIQPPTIPKPRLDFLNSKPPPNYVAGLGRGATGFTTRSDIGPARAAPDLPDKSATTIGGAVAPVVGRGRGKPGEEEEEDEGEDKGYDENQKFDEFEGNDVGLFALAEYDEDDKEVDAVWEAIDKRMDSRRKDRRDARLKEEISSM